MEDHVGFDGRVRRLLHTRRRPAEHGPHRRVLGQRRRAESFFAALKNEMYYRHRFTTRARARIAVVEYIEVFYNRKRSKPTTPAASSRPRPPTGTCCTSPSARVRPPGRPSLTCCAAARPPGAPSMASHDWGPRVRFRHPFPETPTACSMRHWRRSGWAGRGTAKPTLTTARYAGLSASLLGRAVGDGRVHRPSRAGRGLGPPDAVRRMES